MSTEQESEALDIWTHPAPVTMVPIADDKDNVEEEEDENGEG